MRNSPAAIFALYLIEQDLLGDPEASPLDWPVTVGMLPDMDDWPNEAAALFDTSGVKDGRLHSGPNVFFHGVQLRVRAQDQASAWLKVDLLCKALELTQNADPLLGLTTYTIVCVTQVSPPLSLGVEVDARRRHTITVNFLLTIEDPT